MNNCTREFSPTVGVLSEQVDYQAIASMNRLGKTPPATVETWVPLGTKFDF